MSVDKKDFNELVDLVMVDPALSAMRPVVEKELLHYEPTACAESRHAWRSASASV